MRTHLKICLVGIIGIFVMMGITSFGLVTGVPPGNILPHYIVATAGTAIICVIGMLITTRGPPA